MNEYINKNVVIELKNSNKYFGVVKEVTEYKNGLIFISITDKNNKLITFQFGEIVRIEELR